jgi:hypothetical protein
MKFWTNISVVIAIAFASVCSYYLYREFISHESKIGGENIGTITFKKRSASRRFSESVMWEEIAQESPVYNYDAIRTLEYSSAVISLKDGTSIELDQNTMLVVILSQKGVDINFDRGGVSAKSGAGGKQIITLNARDASIALDSGDISVSSSDKGLDISLASGSAKVEAAGGAVNISADETATLKEGKVQAEKKSLFTEFPAHNSYHLITGKSMALNFRWRSDPPGEVKVEIARSSRFSDVFKSFSSGSGSRGIELLPGDYYWRIISGKNKSFPSKFTIMQDSKPELIYPRMNQNVSPGEGSGIIAFRWRESKHASGYEVKVARDPDMKNMAALLVSKINTISAADIPDGTYFWTVKSLYPAGVIGAESVSGPGRFTLQRVQFSLSRPVPVDPGVVTTAAPFTLYWKGVQGAGRYAVEISSDPEFKNSLLKEETANTFIRVDKKIPEGSYYWRINAFRGAVSSDKSDTASLVITKPVEITLLSPKPGTVLYKRPEVINFSWRDPNQGDKYLVEVSERRDFSRMSMVLESDLHSVTGESPGAGLYFWRVVLKNKTNRIIAKSPVSDFSIPAELRAPVLITPVNNGKLLPGAKNRVRFEWRKIHGATEYEVEVFQRIAGAEKTIVIYTSRVNFIEALNPALYRPGMFSWLVRARQIKKGTITAFRESGKSFFEVESVELLPPPEVKEPGVLFK